MNVFFCFRVEQKGKVRHLQTKSKFTLKCILSIRPVEGSVYSINFCSFALILSLIHI